MNIIVAVDRHWGIGKNNGLLFHLPEDLKFFKQKTAGKVVAMGGNTLLSLPNGAPLPDRVNIVISDVSEILAREDIVAVRTFSELLGTLSRYPSDDVFIIGGAMLYQTMLDYCDTAYITKIDADGGADCFFPCLDMMQNWTQTGISAPIDSNGKKIQFTVYKNSEVKNV